MPQNQQNLTKTAIFAKILSFCVILHLAQFCLSVGRWTLIQHTNNKQMELLIGSWDGSCMAERSQLVLDYYAKQTKLKAFLPWEAKEFVYQHLANSEKGLERVMVAKALKDVGKIDRQKKLRLGCGAMWYEIPFGFHYRHCFNLTDAEKFGIDALRELVNGIRNSEVQVGE
ncbi:uncharacterized protein RSE6_04985 [Rhynchosporium secalis]|uniref:Uncharacterized protein n=1 Tax=Rhynchosporium secalis TaxID=38038 RepID=A0A1E1M6N5_RHYSE|nr:uncharacterized protein RSE6_04985 [Rhynchosporium secalis]